MTGITSRPTTPQWHLFNESETPVSTFIPMVVGLVKVVGSDSEREDVRLRLRFEDGSSTEVIVQLSDIDHVDWFEKDHRYIVNSQFRQAGRYIATVIRAGINTAPVERRHILDRTGIHHINDTTIYVAGGPGNHPFPRSRTQFRL